MTRKKFDIITKCAKNQLVIQCNGKDYFVKIQKGITINDIGIIAFSETTGSPEVMLFENMDIIIIDGIHHKCK